MGLDHPLHMANPLPPLLPFNKEQGAFCWEEDALELLYNKVIFTVSLLQ